MSDVFYLRPMDPPIRFDDLPAMAAGAEGCFNIHRVDWRLSLLADDGSEMLCWYQSPDAESVRVALRQLESDMTHVWTGIPKPDINAETVAALQEGITLVDLTAREPETFPTSVDRALGAASFDAICRIESLDQRHCVLLIHGSDSDKASNVFNGADFAQIKSWRCNLFLPPR